MAASVGRPLARSHDLLQLSWIETQELRNQAARIFAINLDHTGDEELLLFIRLRHPKIRLHQGDYEPVIASPFSVLRVGLRAGKGLNVREVVQVPGLANGEGSIRVLFGLVHADAARFPDCDDDGSGFLGFGSSSLRRRRRRRMRREFGDAKVGDVRLLDWLRC
jgi:hypothetical protein